MGQNPELDDRQALYSGFGDTLSRAFEFAVIPLLFGAFGYWVDGWLGITPVFTAILAAVGLAGVVARMWYAYEAAMQAEEAKSPWARSRL